MPLAAPPALPAPPPAPVRYGFRKAEIGMDLASWRASAPQRQSAPCAASSPGVLVCRTPDQPLGGDYRVRELSSTFVGGRLAKVSFSTSIDAFPFATAELKRAFGPPADIRRDRVRLQNGLDLPHVLMTWRNGRSTIRLSDPALRGGRLNVTIASDASAGGPAAGELRGTRPS